MNHLVLTYQHVGEYIVYKIPEFHIVYKDHIKENSVVLPHVLLGDFTRFSIETYRKSKTNNKYKEIFLRTMDLIEEMMASDKKEIQELASVSFLENLHQADKDYGEIKKYLKKKSLQQLEVIENFSSN